MPAPIEVLEVRRLTGAGSVRAVVKVRVGGLVIHGCRVVQEPRQRPRVSMPQMSASARVDGGGGGQFAVVEANEDLMGRIRAAVLEAWGGR